MLSGMLVLSTAGTAFCTPAYAASAVDKSETVYVIKNADGKTEKVLVNENLHCDAGQKTIKDVTFLSDVENISGSETFKKDGANIVWKAEGKNIKYQGTSDALPSE